MKENSKYFFTYTKNLMRNSGKVGSLTEKDIKIFEEPVAGLYRDSTQGFGAHQVRIMCSRIQTNSLRLQSMRNQMKYYLKSDPLKKK